MTLPAVSSTISDAELPQFAPPSPGNWFISGHTLRGPANTPVLLRTLAGAEAILGARDPSSPIYDALDVYFRERGRYVYFSRAVGPDAAKATGELDDSADPTLGLSASSEGEWGNDLEVTVDNDSGSFKLTVELDGTLVATSPFFETNSEAVTWGASSPYLQIFDLGGDVPIDQVVTLTGGLEDRDNVTTDELSAALAAFTPDYGPGQVSLPGFTSEEAHEVLFAHCDGVRRIAKADMTDTADAETLAAHAQALQSADGAEYGGLFAPWDVVPGLAPGHVRVVPSCARNAAIFARGLASGLSVGEPAAGKKLPALYVTDLSQVAWSDADRELLNDAGINVSLIRRGQVITYGNRTVTDALTNPNWAQLNQSTVLAAIDNRAREIGEDHNMSKADARGIRVGDFVGDLVGMLLDEFYRPGDLYGETQDDAFRVTPAVNIEDATASLLATIEARVSPGADRVQIQIFKQPIAA